MGRSHVRLCVHLGEGVCPQQSFLSSWESPDPTPRHQGGVLSVPSSLRDGATGLVSFLRALMLSLPAGIMYLSTHLLKSY